VCLRVCVGSWCITAKHLLLNHRLDRLLLTHAFRSLSSEAVRDLINFAVRSKVGGLRDEAMSHGELTPRNLVTNPELR